MAPDAWYKVRVSDPIAKLAKYNRMPFVTCKCTILEGDYKDISVWYSYARVQHEVRELPASSDEIDRFKPFECFAKVSIETRGPYTINRVKRLTHKSLEAGDDRDQES